MLAPGSGACVADDGTMVPVAEPGLIEASQEYRLMLHRHWSLYDALYYSDHIAARVGTWRADGQNKLMRLLAKMGVAGLFLVLGVVTRKSLLITLVFNPAQLLSGLVGMVGVAKANPFFLLLNIMVTLFCISLVAATVVLENIDIGRERAFGTTVWWSVTETT